MRHEFTTETLYFNDKPTPSFMLRRIWKVTDLTAGMSYLKTTAWLFDGETRVPNVCVRYR